MWKRFTCINGLKACFNYALSHLGVVRFTHRPVFAAIEPANFCQLHCPECPVGLRSHSSSQTASPAAKYLSLDDYRLILSRLSPSIHTLMLYWQGEPLLNKNLPEMVRLAKAEGLFVMLSTNAQLLTETTADALYRAGLDRIVISIDGFTPSSYAQYRVGGSLDKALRGLRYRSAKVVELQVLRLRSNEQEWAWIRRHYRALGADRLVFKTAQFYDFEQGHPLMPSNPKYSRYQLGKDGLYHLRHPVKMPCRRLWMGCVVDALGDVYPCCYDKDRRYPLGNLLTQSLDQVWFGSRADQIRRQWQQKPAEICKNCAG